MESSVFLELRFWLLVAFSLLVPVLIYVYLFTRQAISEGIVLVFGIVLMLVAGIDVYLLQTLAKQLTLTPSLLDDKIFNSSFEIALYILPVTFAGVGVNIISHVLMRNLSRAEGRHAIMDKERREHV